MNKNTINIRNQPAKIPAKPVSKSVVLLDGRIVQAEIGKPLRILDRDGNSTPVPFDALKDTNSFHQSIFHCLSTTLSTHSLRYNSTVFYSIEKWLKLPAIIDKELIGIPEINLLSEIPPGYRPFIMPLLRRIKNLDPEVFSDEALNFLENPYKWEEKNNGAYYHLLTNDPERGALTEQEIHNIHAQLNKAFSEGLITQRAFALCWFFIGTGVRPVQARRMKKRGSSHLRV